MLQSDYISPTISLLEIDAEGVLCSSTQIEIGDWIDDGIDQGGDAI